MLFLITICKISSRFRYFGMDLVSYRAIFPVSVQLDHIHPLRQNRNGAKIKSTPTHLYHTKILGNISSNTQKPNNHTIKEPYTTNNIYQKKVFCIASRLTITEKDIPTAYPYIADCTISAQITTYQRTIHPTADKNHITLSCQSGSQYKSQIFT